MLIDSLPNHTIEKGTDINKQERSLFGKQAMGKFPLKFWQVKSLDAAKTVLKEQGSAIGISICFFSFFLFAVITVKPIRDANSAT